MKLIFMFVLITISGCINHQGNYNHKPISKEDSEDFTIFNSMFYSDSNFQNSRIIKPLKGTIKNWDDDVIKEESWINKEVIVTPKERFMQVYNNLKVDLIKNDTIVIEKYWIEQSGFLIEKCFILKSGKWYLYSYNISNL